MRKRFRKGNEGFLDEGYYEPNCITTISLFLRRTAYTFGNTYHHIRRSLLLSTIDSFQTFFHHIES
jgi:hypothetical protein